MRQVWETRDARSAARTWRPTITRLSLLAVLGGLGGIVLGTSVDAAGQDRGRGRAEAEAPRAGAEPGEDEDVSASGEEVEEGGGSKIKVYEFGGLDISGRLKSPQLLYFLNRLRAEFDRPRLPHRSFMPEMSRSTKGKAF
jgi:hypothetical protein